jgi:hypothetical protein
MQPALSLWYLVRGGSKPADNISRERLFSADLTRKLMVRQKTNVPI